MEEERGLLFSPKYCSGCCFGVQGEWSEDMDLAGALNIPNWPFHSCFDQKRNM